MRSNKNNYLKVIQEVVNSDNITERSRRAMGELLVSAVEHIMEINKITEGGLTKDNARQLFVDYVFKELGNFSRLTKRSVGRLMVNQVDKLIKVSIDTDI